MNEELFDVVFFGILQAGKDKDTVMQNMATLFKTDAAKLAPYFAGGRKVIKGNINAAAADKYRAALVNIGLSIKIEPSDGSAQNKTAKPATSSETATAAQQNGETNNIDTAGLALAATGSDIMENPIEVPAQKIDDISDITIAETGADVIENPVKVPPQQIDDISDITVAEVGTDVLDHPQQVTPQKIDDISGISLAEAGVDLIENPQPKAEAKIPDTSELSLSNEKT